MEPLIQKFDSRGTGLLTQHSNVNEVSSRDFRRACALRRYHFEAVLVCIVNDVMIITALLVGATPQCFDYCG